MSGGVDPLTGRNTGPGSAPESEVGGPLATTSLILTSDTQDYEIYVDESTGLGGTRDLKIRRVNEAGAYVRFEDNDQSNFANLVASQIRAATYNGDYFIAQDNLQAPAALISSNVQTPAVYGGNEMTGIQIENSAQGRLTFSGAEYVTGTSGLCQIAADGTIQKVPSASATTWTIVTPAADFGFFAPTSDMAYKKLDDNTVCIEGILQRTGIGVTPNLTPLFTLPIGFRPTGVVATIGLMGTLSFINGNTYIQINAGTGVVSVTNTNFLNTNDFVAISMTFRIL